MYYQIQNKVLKGKKLPTSKEKNIPLSGFSFISGISFKPGGDELYLTGVLVGNQLPSWEHQRRGDIHLFKTRIDDGNWQCIYAHYAHDPTPIPNTDDVAFHNGNGISVIDQSGKIICHHKLGKFNWGAPSLSSSPDGKRIAYIKWQGDRKKICTVNPIDCSFEKYKPSCYWYTWFDDDSIVYNFGIGLRILDPNTGKNRLFIRDLKSFTRRNFKCKDPKYLDYLCSDQEKRYDFGPIRCFGDLIYFGCNIFTTFQGKVTNQLRGLFSIDRNKEELKLVHILDPDMKMNILEIDQRGNIQMEIERYEVAKVIEWLTLSIGPDQQLLSQGWRIFRNSTFPEFRFHYFGQFD